MKIGVCSSIEKACIAVKAGYDYAELNLKNVAAMTEDEFKAYVDQKNSLGIASPCFAIKLQKEPSKLLQSYFMINPKYSN